MGHTLVRRTRRLLTWAWCALVIAASVTYLAAGDGPRAVGTVVVGLLLAAVVSYPDEALRTGRRRPGGR